MLLCFRLQHQTWELLNRANQVWQSCLFSSSVLLSSENICTCCQKYLAHIHSHAHAHTHTHTHSLSLLIPLFFSPCYEKKFLNSPGTEALLGEIREDITEKLVVNMASKVPLTLVTQTGEKNNQLYQARVNQKEKAPDMGTDLKEKL